MTFALEWKSSAGSKTEELLLQELRKKLDTFDAQHSVITVQRRPAVVPATPTPRSGRAPRPRQLEVPATTIRTPIRSAGLMSATSKLSVGYESATISTVRGNVAEAGPSNHKPQVQDNMQVDEALARRLQKSFNEEARFRQLDEAGSEDDVGSDDHPGSPMQEDSDGDEYVEGADNKGKGKAKGQAKRKGKGKEPAGVKERETGKGGAGAGDPKASGRVKNRAEATDKIHKPPCECCVEKKSICRVDANGGACAPCKRRKTKCSLAPLRKPSIRRPRPANRSKAMVSDSDEDVPAVKTRPQKRSRPMLSDMDTDAPAVKRSRQNISESDAPLSSKRPKRAAAVVAEREAAKVLAAEERSTQQDSLPQRKPPPTGQSTRRTRDSDPESLTNLMKGVPAKPFR